MNETPRPEPEPEPPSAHVSARVPEKVARGVFSDACTVLPGQGEFVLDFMQRMVHPNQVAARVIVSPRMVPGLIKALADNLQNYTARFGPPPALLPLRGQPPSTAELYDDMKLSDDVAAGVFANSVIITHSQTDFCLDFIAKLFPRPVVTARIYFAAPHMPGVIQALMRADQQFQQRPK